jgi:hypothetical protein
MPIKAIIRHLLSNAPAEDISKGLEELGFGAVSIKQMTAMRPSPHGGNQQVTLPLSLITLPRSSTSAEIFKVMNLCHIIIKVEVYRAQTGLTQCYNCQKFGHVWPNCRQPPHCLWYEGGHFRRSAQNKAKKNQYHNAATDIPIPLHTGAAGM